MRAFAALALFIVFLPGRLAGQQWRSYTDLNPVRALAASGHVLWAGTEGGVFSFSTAGTSPLDVYTNVDGLPSTCVTSAAIGSHGRSWFGTSSSGAAVLDSSLSRFDIVNTRDQNIVSDSINAVLCSGDYAFLGSPGGLSFFDGLAWQTYTDRQFPMGPSVLSLAWRRDSLFIGTDRGLTAAPLAGLTGRNPALWCRYSNMGIGDSAVLSLSVSGTGVLAGTGRGLALLSGPSWSELANLGRQVRSVLVLRDTAYLATSGGAWRWAGGAAAQISSGLPSPDVRALSLDGDSSLWAGTAEGLAGWDGTAWHPYPLDCIPSNNVSRVASGSDGSVWLAHDGGYASRIKADGSVIAYQNPVPGIPVSSLVVDPAGNAWYGMSWWDGSGRTYVVRVSPSGIDTVITSPPLPPTCGIWDGFAGGDGLLYFAAYSHLATNYIVVLRPEGSLASLLVDPGQSAYLNPISVARDASGAVWVGQFTNRLARFDPATQAWAYFGHESGLSDAQFWDIAVDPSGSLWLASSNGLNRCRYDPALGRLSDIRVFQSPGSPLAGNDVRAVALDRSGNRWIATDGGLSMLSWDGKWTGYTSGDAFANGSRLLSDDVRCVTARPRDSSGDDILIATPRGLSIFSHSKVAAGAEPSAHVAPNPFRPGSGALLLFSNLPDRAAVSLHALDGRRLASWAGPAAPAHTLAVDPSTVPGGLPSGLYLCLVRPASGKAQVIKLAVVR